MKKIPCLFQREFRGREVTLLDDVTVGCEWVLDGEGEASRKWDGTACAVIDGCLYKRYDVKKGKSVPVGAIPCQDPDPVTGHWPHWVLVDATNPNDKWHVDVWDREGPRPDGTYELIGPKVNNNPEGIEKHCLVRHGQGALEVPRTKDGIRAYLEAHEIEGVVFAHPDGRMCKIRRADFGLKWPVKQIIPA